MRRPLFKAGFETVQISDVDELRPYAAQLKVRAYDNSVATEPVDAEFIERYLEEEFAVLR